MTHQLPKLPPTARACKMGNSHCMGTTWEIWDHGEKVRRLSEGKTLREARNKAREKLASESQN
jgi:hypothetical protein